MRIAIFSTCPGGDFAAGSYHGLMAGYCLARRGHNVYFVTDHRPAFDADLRPISPENPVTIVLTKDFEVFSDLRFDHVIVASQKVQDRRVCMNAIRIAEYNQAALSFFALTPPTGLTISRPLDRWRSIGARGICRFPGVP
jgi:hypothetical protein